MIERLTYPNPSWRRVCVAACVVGASAVAGYIADHQTQAPNRLSEPAASQTGRLGAVMTPIGEDPWPDGRQVTLSQGQQLFAGATGDAIAFPSTGLAAASNATDAFYHATPLDSGSSVVDVALQVAYVDRGFTIRYETPGPVFASGPAATYQRLYDSLGRDTNILTTVSGIPIFVQPQGENGPGSFDMVVGGVRVVAIGNLTNDQLRDLAQDVISVSASSTAH